MKVFGRNGAPPEWTGYKQLGITYNYYLKENNNNIGTSVDFFKGEHHSNFKLSKQHTDNSQVTWI